MSSLPPVNSTIFRTFGAPADGTELARRIADDIIESGPITFRELMERALYEPGSGYYRRQQSPWSGPGDYTTAPQVHRAVGEAIARLAVECDAALESPSRFDLLEMGGGDGRLLRDCCDALKRSAPELYRRLAVWSVERSEPALAAQRERLAGHAERVRWLGDLNEAPADGWCGLVATNELVDAFPVHRVTWQGGRLFELLVDVDGDRFVERSAELSTERLSEYLDFNGISLADGQVAEICLAAEDWLAALDAQLRGGCLLTIDYGADSSVLYAADRRDGSLVCQRRFQLGDNPYEHLGDQDITSHVDVGNLRRRGERLGLETVGESSLTVFLLGFGAAEGAGLAAAEGRDLQGQRDHFGLRHLLFSEIGETHRVLLQSKGVGAIRFGRERLS